MTKQAKWRRAMEHTNRANRFSLRDYRKIGQRTRDDLGPCIWETRLVTENHLVFYLYQSWDKSIYKEQVTLFCKPEGEQAPF